MSLAIDLAERGLLPEPTVRWGIRRLLSQRLKAERSRYGAGRDQTLETWIEEMRESPVAVHTREANEQHYEVEAEFFRLVLGRHLKYSSGFWRDGVDELDEAEADMLALTGERAGLADGMDVLELGCGWGSLTLWMAERFPASRILAVSNSASQRRFILARAAERGLDNVAVETHDVNGFETERIFDRVVSVEMFEHVRNWERLLGRIEGWLAPGGRLFTHVFAHREFAYPFETDGDSNWMGRYFFTGGMMPSDDLFARVESPLEVAGHWVVDGTHYARTAEAWVRNLDRNREGVMPVLRRVYGTGAERWFQRWRIFFLACAELFGFDSGREWWVSHNLLAPAREAARVA